MRRMPRCRERLTLYIAASAAAIRVAASRPDVRVSATPTLARHDHANVGVVDALEVVEIEVGNGQRRTGTMRARQVGVEQFL